MVSVVVRPMPPSDPRRPAPVLLALLLLLLVWPPPPHRRILAAAFRAAPATPNTVDSADPQRLPLTRVACGCHFANARIEPAPLPSSTAFLDIGSGRLRGSSRIRQKLDPGERPQRLECSCTTRPSNARVFLPQAAPPPSSPPDQPSSPPDQLDGEPREAKGLDAE